MLTRRWLLRLLTLLLLSIASEASAKPQEIPITLQKPSKEHPICSVALVTQNKLGFQLLKTFAIAEAEPYLESLRVQVWILKFVAVESNKTTRLPHARAPPG